MLGKWSYGLLSLAGLSVLILAPWRGGPGSAAATLTGKDEDRPAEKFARGPGGQPITGKGVDILSSVDAAVEKIMLRHGIPGASLAITKDGRLVHARGYGWAYHEKKEPATPKTLFGLASVSKVFTALAALKLVEEGKLKLDQKAFDLLKHIKPPPGAAVDPRLSQITIRQLLNHSGGWDRERSGDPINWSLQVAGRLKVDMPITEDHLISYMMGVRLDFNPGTRSQYSNFGYIALGQIVAKASGMTYEEYVKTRVMKPMGITRARLHDHAGKYFDGEARRYNPGLMYYLPAYNMPWTDASGGWSASAVDLARLMTAIDGSRGGKPFLGPAMMKEMFAPPPPPQRPRPDGSYFGLGWDTVKKLPAGFGYTKGGLMPGQRASVRHRVDGINVILVYNAVITADHIDMRIANDALQDVHEALAAVKEWPKVNFFDDF
jgi:N-acyl-D-amino-acid deacylase